MVHFWSDSRNPPCCSSSHLGLLWKVILFAPLLLQLVLAQDEVHRHIVRFPNCHGLGNLTNRHIARIHILMKWGRSTKSIICRKLVWIEIFVLTHPKMPRKMLNCVNFLTRLLLNKQVGEMDNTDVPSDYTSNCLPPNCLPRWTWMKVIDNFNIYKQWWFPCQPARPRDNKGTTNPEQSSAPSQLPEHIFLKILHKNISAPCQMPELNKYFSKSFFQNISAPCQM